MRLVQSPIMTRPLVLIPLFTEAYVNRGNAKLGQGDAVGAIADYDKAISLNPTDAGAYFGRGHAKRTQGNFDEAISDFDKALELGRAQNMLSARIEIIEAARAEAIEARDKANPDDSKT